LCSSIRYKNNGNKPILRNNSNTNHFLCNPILASHKYVRGGINMLLLGTNKSDLEAVWKIWEEHKLLAKDLKYNRYLTIDTHENTVKGIRLIKTQKTLDEALHELELLQNREHPKKPRKGVNGREDCYDCAVCMNTIYERHVHVNKKYCDVCGTRIDWSEQE